MRDPGRILKKILKERCVADPDLTGRLEAAGEPLDLLVETLREVIRCRRWAAWLRGHLGLDACVAPQNFHALLDIPEVNLIEETDRNLDVTHLSVKDRRQPDDPVTVANLNALLREIFRDLSGLHEIQTRDHPRLLLGAGISGDLVDRVESCVRRVRALDLRGVGFLLTGPWVRAAEQEFTALFPEAPRPLRRNLDAVQVELGFYYRCLEVNIRWAPMDMDLFRTLREDTLGQAADNLSALGAGLWNVVYNGMKLPATLSLAGIDFGDIRTLLDPERVALVNV